MIGRSLHGGETIALYGELGSGKTALVRGIAAGLDGAPQVVSSPTFVLIQTYHGRIPLVHADLYRLHTPDDVRHLGLEDYFDGRSVIAVEWAEKADEELTSDRLEVYFIHLKRTRRLLNFRATGRRSSRLLTRVKKAHTDQLPASTKATRSKKTSPFNVQ